tara:strand:- start:3491 stop:4561 length:1071 start_codon:yes stop_codon:yes gene_type:complete
MEKKFRIFKQVPKLIFGENSINRIHELVPSFDLDTDYVLIVFDIFFKDKTPEILPNYDKEIIFFNSKESEPKTSQINDFRDHILKLRDNKIPRLIIAVGGGSSMDVGKSLSTLFTNKKNAEDYQGWDLPKNRGVHKIGVPSIAGSGSEASRTAVLTSKHKKMGINSDFSMFDSIILDPNLLKTVPKDLFIYSAMDCYIHCVESLEGTYINTLSRSYAETALKLCTEALMSENPNLSKLLTASYLGGVSIVNSEVGVAHALSYGISLEYGYRHGLANCIIFNHLEEYYGSHVKTFKKILNKHKITLPTNLSSKFNQDKIDKMIDTALLMERPLENAFGENWKNIFTREEIESVYKKL